MRLIKLILKNIRSFKYQEIEFPDGALLLAGDIGAGKTTILLAIEYALFGLQPGQKGSALLRNNSSNGEVSLAFEINNKTILVERKLKRSSKSVTNDYAAITIDNEKIESSVTEIKTKILQLLSYPPEFIKKNNILYRYTVYTPQEQMKQIILEDPETRLNILRHIFSIDKYKRIRENLLVLSNSLKEFSKVLQGEIKTLVEDKENLEKSKRLTIDIREKIKEKEDELNNKIEKRKKAEFEIQELENKMKQKQQFEKELEKTSVLLTTKRENQISISKEIAEIQKTIKEMGERFDEDIYQSLINEINEKNKFLEDLNSQYFNYTGYINSLEKHRANNLQKIERIFQIDICPTCLQDVSENHKHNIKNESEKDLAEIKRNLENSEKEKSGLLMQIEKERLKKSELDERKLALEILRTKTDYAEKAREKLNEFERTKQTFEEDINLLEKHLENIRSQILSHSKFNILYKNKQTELKTFFQDERKVEIILAELKKELELTYRQIEDIQNQIIKKETSKKKLSELIELNGWFFSHFLNLIEFIERNILRKLRDEFSKLFNKWFLMLVPSESFEVQLDESFTPIILQSETEMDYNFLSGGERTAVALAYRLALNQTLNSLLSRIQTRDIIMLDEPTDGFSEQQLDRVRDILFEMNVLQLIIVSHEPKIEGFVDKVLKLKKEGDVSIIYHKI